MIVMRGDEGVDGDDAVAAGPVFDDHRLAPALAEPIGQQARADIGAAAGPSVKMNLTGRVGQAAPPTPMAMPQQRVRQPAERQKITQL